MSNVQTSPSIANLIKALIAFSGEMPKVEKTKQVKVRTKGGHEYTFDYAPLEEITDKARPILIKNGLVVTQFPSGNGLMTMLAHESGEYIHATMNFATSASSNQEQGSQMTYNRRYGYTAVLNLVTDDDDDGNGADGNTPDFGTGAPRASNPAPSASRPAPSAPAPSGGSDVQKDWLNALDKNGMPTERGLKILDWAIANKKTVKDVRQNYAVNKADASWLENMLAQAGPKGNFPSLDNIPDDDDLPF